MRKPIQAWQHANQEAGNLLRCVREAQGTQKNQLQRGRTNCSRLAIQRTKQVGRDRGTGVVQRARFQKSLQTLKAKSNMKADINATQAVT